VEVNIRPGDGEPQQFVLHGTATVTDLNLSAPRLPPPIAGGSPATTLGGTPSEQWTAESVAWANAGDTEFTGDFKAGTAYKAEVKLTAKPGWTFVGVEANSFIHGGKDENVSPNPINAADSGTVTVVFPATAKEMADNILTDRIAVPTANNPTVTTLSRLSDEWEVEGAVKWFEKEKDGWVELTQGATFAEDRVYKAEVKLTAKPDHTFFGKGANFFIHGGKDENVSPNPTNTTFMGTGPDQVTVTVVFPVTTQVVTQRNLSEYVTAAVGGQTPNTDSIDDQQYTGTVEWVKADDSSEFTGTFEAGTKYKAKVTLTAKTGWTFTGVGADAFSYKDKNTNVDLTPINAANSGTVYITFPATVSNLDLSGYVTRPVGGQSSSANLTGSLTQYTGAVAWFNAADDSSEFTGTFEAGTKYKAKVTLTAKTGWTFNGVMANSFNHDDRDIEIDPNPTNAADSGTVTIVFSTAEAPVSADSFSNATDTATSAIDLTKKAKSEEGKSFVYIMLPTETKTEQVDLSNVDSDIGAWGDSKKGLTLNATNSPAKVVIDGSGWVVDLTTGSSSPLITVGTGVTLTLKNITFKGLRSSGDSDNKDDSANNDRSLINVTGGTLILEDGAVIRDNYRADSNGFGAGVYVISGELIMKGGAIRNNKAEYGGGGVHVYTGAKFTMSGGAISGNTCVGAPFGGGVGVYGEFIMSGGAISGNTAAKYGGGVGVIDTNSVFIMEGGTISGNTATQYGGGVGVQSGTFIKADSDGDSGTIYGSDAGDGLKNTSNNGNGHAAYAGGKKRTDTADGTVDLNSTSDTNWDQ
jgi:hypothetical protein